LLFAMVLSLFLGETTDGVIVLAIVLGSALQSIRRAEQVACVKRYIPRLA
jgi:hypothetical protein